MNDDPKSWWQNTERDSPADYFASPQFERLTIDVAEDFKKRHRAFEGLIEDAVFYTISNFVIKVQQQKLRLDDFDNEIGLRQFILTACRWRIADFARSEKRRRIECNEVASIPSIDNLERIELKEIIQDALEKLPKSRQLIVRRYYFDGLNTKEIAKEIGRSKRTVEIILRQARESLKLLLTGNDDI